MSSYLTPFSRGNSIFSLFDEFERNIFDNAFGSLHEGSTFRTDIRENKDAYLLEAELPGFGKDNIDIDLQGDTLTITAKKDDANEQKGEDGFIRRERRYGSFQRSFDVSGIDTENIKADYQNGVLKLLLPKQGAVQQPSRRIEIGGGGEGPFLEENNG